MKQNKVKYARWWNKQYVRKFRCRLLDLDFVKNDMTLKKKKN